MKWRSGAILVFGLLVLGPVILWSQTSQPPSLKEQLEAQYPPGTVLTIQKEGILGVASTSNTTCAAKYQGGKLNPPEASCSAPLMNSSRLLTVGEKVHPSKIDVDLAKGRILFHIVECDSCNHGVQSSSYKSQIAFQFARGYLENAGVSQIEDSISEVLAFETVAEQQPEPAQESQTAPGQQAEPSREVITNADVVKMTKAKLGDGIILSKIKASPSSFDMTVDALVKLKEAGVSDAVIAAMQEAQQPAGSVENEPPTPEQTPGQTPSPGTYAAAFHNGNHALVFAAESDRTFAVDVVDHNGERALRLRVQHLHMSNCTGYLYISHNRISYDPVDTPNFQKDAFDLQRSEFRKTVISKVAFTGHTTVGIFTEKKRYFFYPLFDQVPGSKASLHQTLDDIVRTEGVYEFIGRSLTDFDGTLHEAETLTASLTPGQ